MTAPILAVFILVNLPGAAVAPAPTRLGPEALMSAAVDSQGITFQVPTGGCTAKENFGLETVEKTPLTVRLVRLRPDYCKAHLPAGVKIKFTYAEIGAGPILDPPAQKALVILNENH